MFSANDYGLETGFGHVDLFVNGGKNFGISFLTFFELIIIFNISRDEVGVFLQYFSEVSLR